MLQNIKTFEKNVDYVFKNKDLLKEALTHRSYLNENPKWEVPHNERLEFLGDAVLELIVTEELYNRYPDYKEGPLTGIRAALVNYVMMATVAKSIDLEKYVLMSRGEAKDTGRARDVILANAIEAVIGAIYLDDGYAPAKKFVVTFVLEHLEEVFKKGLIKDAKSNLQEKAQSEFKITPIYKVLEESGPDHQKVFRVGVYIGEKHLATGSGQAKQDAEVDAAKQALTKWEE
ncbi:MAG: ribonuclease III [Parcubacteria group bacterium Gr01-1014_3]|nr:MAG: ribonuclease III [Parcubacteria group bacterium Gr01-1014_3]